jgi:hypothetical protein
VLSPPPHRSSAARGRRHGLRRGADGYRREPPPASSARREGEGPSGAAKTDERWLVGGGLKDKLVVGPTPVVAVREASDFSTAVGRPTPSNSVKIMYTSKYIHNRFAYIALIRLTPTEHPKRDPNPKWVRHSVLGAKINLQWKRQTHHPFYLNR